MFQKYCGGWLLSVPNVFSSSFQCVPQDVLNSTSFFFPYCLAMVQLSCIFLTCKEVAKGKHAKGSLNVGDQSILAPCSKSIVVGQSNSSLWEGERKGKKKTKLLFIMGGPLAN